MRDRGTGIGGTGLGEKVQQIIIREQRWQKKD